jgi:hypothetical protein
MSPEEIGEVVPTIHLAGASKPHSPGARTIEPRSHVR